MPKSLYMWKLLLVLSFIHAETVETSPRPRKNPFDDLMVSYRTLGEMSCLRRHDLAGHNQGYGFNSSYAQANMETLAVPLEKLFKDYGVSPFERAAFYAQTAYESSYYTSFVQGQKAPVSTEYVSPERLTEQTKAASQAAAEKAAGAAVATRLNFIGRGPLQLTGCANYISALHYINLKNNGDTPKFESYWYSDLNNQPTMVNHDDNPMTDPVQTNFKLGESCTADDIAAISASYEQKFGYALDPYNLLTPEGLKNLTVAGHKFNRDPRKAAAPGLARTVDSYELMMHMNFAYWRGRCGHLQPIAKENPPAEPCPLRGEPTQVRRIGRCYTECIKGNEACVSPPGEPSPEHCVRRRELFEMILNKENKCFLPAELQ